MEKKTENYQITFMPQSLLLNVNSYRNADKPSIDDYDGLFVGTRKGAIVAEGFCTTNLNSIDALQVALFESYQVDKIVIKDRVTNENFLVLE